MKRLHPRRAADNAITYLLLLAVSALFLFPCLWLILASFSKSGDIYSFSGFFRPSTARARLWTCSPTTSTACTRMAVGF